MQWSPWHDSIRVQYWKNVSRLQIWLKKYWKQLILGESCSWLPGKAERYRLQQVVRVQERVEHSWLRHRSMICVPNRIFQDMKVYKNDIYWQGWALAWPNRVVTKFTILSSMSLNSTLGVLYHSAGMERARVLHALHTCRRGRGAWDGCGKRLLVILSFITYLATLPSWPLRT
jgi:hypothetical protein